MKRKDTNHPNIVAAQIIHVGPKKITVVTEEGCLLRIPLTKEYQQDQILRASLIDILKAGIWIPVNQKLKKLFNYDWLTFSSLSLIPTKN